MARAGITLLAATALSASAAPILLQTDGVSAGLVSELQLVESFVNKFLKEKAPITDKESEMFAAVYKMFDETTLPNIQTADASDRKTLDDHIAAIKACDNDVVSV